jgi:hypothetical protein
MFKKNNSKFLKCRYDLLALTASLLWLIAGTKFVLGLYDRINYAMHRPNQDVSTLCKKNFEFYFF